MTVAVAPRELHDYCYRAIRTGGVHAGKAETLAAASVFSVTHLGQPIDRLLTILEAGNVPLLGLPYVLRAAQSLEPVDVPSGSVIADFAYFAVRGSGEQVTLAAVNVDGTTVPAAEWFASRSPVQLVSQLVTVPNETAIDRGTLQARLDEQTEAVQRSGVDLHDADWDRLDVLAQRYLISERAIDAAVRDIATS